jgi:hypothetical protein
LGQGAREGSLLFINNPSFLFLLHTHHAARAEVPKNAAGDPIQRQTSMTILKPPLKFADGHTAAIFGLTIDTFFLHLAYVFATTKDNDCHGERTTF